MYRLITLLCGTGRRFFVIRSSYPQHRMQLIYHEKLLRLILTAEVHNNNYYCNNNNGNRL